MSYNSNNNFFNNNNNVDFSNKQTFDNFDNFFDRTPNNSNTKVSNYTIGYNTDNKINFNNDINHFNNDINHFNNFNVNNSFNNARSFANNFNNNQPKQRYHIGCQDPSTKTRKVYYPAVNNTNNSNTNNNTNIKGDIKKGSEKTTEVRSNAAGTLVTPSMKGRISDEDVEVKYLGQDYESIKKECLLNQCLWEDDEFPANMTSLFPSGNSGGWDNFEWKRPGEICPNPRMFIGGHERFDISQGELGNCWFLAATASLCSVKKGGAFEKVVPKDNNNVYVGNDYAGIFKFKIWQYGRWTEVVVDDRLPTKDSRLVFVHSPKNNEFWPALLEKAYAKINGSYEALQGGNVGEAMVDFTGGIVNAFDLTKTYPNDLFKVMKQAFERDSLLGCSIDPQIVGGDIEGKLANGLITGHAYSITGLRSGVGGVELIRIRNPWGNGEEWKGAWSDGSAEWKTMSESVKKSLELNFEDDGEFWMSYKDFVKNFTHIEICVSTPRHDLIKSNVELEWKKERYEGSWKRGVNAGGCRNNLNTFSTNPQYIIEVTDVDASDDVNKGTILIALLQKDRRKLKNRQSFLSTNQEMLTIGYYIYKLPAQHTGLLDINFFKYNLSTAKSPSFSNVREMVGRHKLSPGKYCIIPATFKPNQDGHFLLRIFSEKAFSLSEADEETGFVSNIATKVKTDMPVYADQENKQAFKGMVPADCEIRRAKTLLVTPEDVAETKDIKNLFKKVSGEDMQVDAEELKTIMENKFKPEFQFDGFSLETTKSMVALMDTDHSGKLRYEEFKCLWEDILFWKKVFLQYNNNNLATIGSFELRSALNSAGFLVSNHTLQCLCLRFANKQSLLFFNTFVQLAVRLKCMFAVYDELIRDKNVSSLITLDQFIQTTMYS